MAGEHVPDPLDAFALLDDDYGRSILAALSHQPMTANELSDQCAMSRTTVYRRLEALEQCGFISAETIVDAEGHHRQRYTTQFEELRVRLIDGEFKVRLATKSLRTDFADTLTELWEGL